LCWAEPGQDLGGGRGGTLVLKHVVYVAANEHRLARLREFDAAEPRAAQQRAHPAGVGQGESSTRPGHLAEAEYRRGPGEPDSKQGVLIAGAPANERQPAAAPQRLPQVGERRRRILEEHHTEVAHHHVEAPALERVHLSTLLDKLPPAGSVPVLGLLRIHRHEGHATSPPTAAGAAPDAPSSTFLLEIATVAGPCQSGEFCAQPLL